MIRWIRRKFQFVQCSDTYCLTVPAKRQGILQAIEQRRHLDQAMFVVAHFPSTFFQMQEWLEENEADYVLLDRKLPAEALTPYLQKQQQTGGTIVLALADLLAESEDPVSLNGHDRLSMLVVERHPLRRHDERLCRYARRLGTPIRLGYFVALDDPAIKPFVGDWTPMLLRQMGMREHDLITSHLVGRRMESVYRKLDRQVANEQSADSPEEWIERNLPTRYHRLKPEPRSSQANPSR